MMDEDEDENEDEFDTAGNAGAVEAANDACEDRGLGGAMGI
jgi:hypothetical protein